METSRLAPMVIALTLVLSACSTGSQGSVDAAPPSEGGAAILDFTAPGLDGPDIVGQDYSGKDVALWFWAPW